MKIHQHSSLRINPIVCAAYGADFDGDEMNLHGIQGEARHVLVRNLRVSMNMTSPHDGRDVLAPIQDAKLGIWEGLVDLEGSSESVQDEGSANSVQDPDAELERIGRVQRAAVRAVSGRATVEWNVKFRQSGMARMVRAGSKGKERNLLELEELYGPGMTDEQYHLDAQNGRMSLVRSSALVSEEGYLNRMLVGNLQDVVSQDVGDLQDVGSQDVQSQDVDVGLQKGPLEDVPNAGIVAALALGARATQASLSAFHDIHNQRAGSRVRRVLYGGAKQDRDQYGRDL